MSPFYDSKESEFESRARTKAVEKIRKDDGKEKGKEKKMQNEQTEVVKLQDLWYDSLMSNCMHDLQRKLTYFTIC